MLYSTNFDPIYHLLLIREDQAPSMETIPQGILLMELTGFSVNVLTAVGGLYGYARLSRYVLTYVFILRLRQSQFNLGSFPVHSDHYLANFVEHLLALDLPLSR
jgi:hypothetical protein